MNKKRAIISVNNVNFVCGRGLKAVDKRDGGGAHNWGTIKDDIEYVALCTTSLCNRYIVHMRDTVGWRRKSSKQKLLENVAIIFIYCIHTLVSRYF